MRRIIALFLMAVLVLSGCAQAETPSPEQPTPQAETSENMEEGTAVSIFAKSDCFVGDTMPYFEDGVMNVFYLADLRDGNVGYHPWGLLRTEDFLTYEDAGIVLPYVEGADQQENALGTGCVMKDQNGLYHAFYTGHNDYRDPKEAVMHATSSDMLNWTKIPEDTFTGGEKYSQTDFRDPYVFWVEEDQCYWMLVVTRTPETGVIVKYTSTDLSKWKDEGIFFTDDMGYGTNMECPSVLEYKGKWYLAFSDQWPERVVHYRVSDSLKGEFKKLDKDTIDGNGFYAGRMETDGENLYLVGWNGTKFGHDDYNDYDWAGNMVIHQVEQQPDGSLKPVVNPKLVDALSHAKALNPVAMTDTIEKTENGYKMAGNQYELVQFDMMDDSNRLEADISGFGSEGVFGISFAPDFEQVAALNLLFNVKENRVEFQNTERIYDDDPQSAVDFDFTGKDSIHVTMLVNNGVVSLFIDGEVALTARMYRSTSSNWQLVGINSAVTWQNLELYY